jgi:hypothetical protein
MFAQAKYILCVALIAVLVVQAGCSKGNTPMAPAVRLGDVRTRYQVRSGTIDGLRIEVWQFRGFSYPDGTIKLLIRIVTQDKQIAFPINCNATVSVVSSIGQEVARWHASCPLGHVDLSDGVEIDFDALGDSLQHPIPSSEDVVQGEMSFDSKLKLGTYLLNVKIQLEGHKEIVMAPASLLIADPKKK